MESDAAQGYLWVPLVVMLASLMGLLTGGGAFIGRGQRERGLATTGIVLSLLGVVGLVSVLVFLPF